jgi:hypothetical protein
MDAGVKSFNSANDVAQAQERLLGGGNNSSGSKAAPVDQGKASQAVATSKAWQDQAGSGGSGAGAGGQRTTPGGFGGSGSYADSPGWGLLADDLSGDYAQRSGIYATIGEMGDKAGNEFRSIGRQYYNNAFREGGEINRAAQNAVASLSPNINLTDYLDPFKSGYGPKGQSLVAMTRDFMDG